MKNYTTEQKVIKYRLSPNLFDLVVIDVPLDAPKIVIDIMVAEALATKRVYPEPKENV